VSVCGGGGGGYACNNGRGRACGFACSAVCDVYVALNYGPWLLQGCVCVWGGGVEWMGWSWEGGRGACSEEGLLGWVALNYASGALRVPGGGGLLVHGVCWCCSDGSDGCIAKPAQ
jgi:hypothetical protein